MIDSFIRFLILLVIIAACYFLGIWVLGEMGIAIPHMVLVCIEVLAVLVIVLIAWRWFGGYVSGYSLWPPRNPPAPPHP